MDKKFIRNVLTLVGGTAGAQLILLTATPILTRIYTPEDFGVFSIFVSLSIIIGVISALRYDVVIPLPNREFLAFNVLVLGAGISLLVALFVFSVSSLIEYKWEKEIAGFIDYTSLMLLSLFVFFYGINQVFNYWKIRNNKYKEISLIRISQSTVIVLVQLGVGLFWGVSSGLIFGYVIGFIVSALMYVVFTYKTINLYIGKIKALSIKRVFKRYSSFSVMSSGSSLVNNLGLHMPILMFGYMFNAEVVGFLMLANRVLGAPVNMLGQAVGSVYLSDAPKVLRENPRELKKIYWLISKKIITIAFIPCIIVLFLAPDIFTFVFGKEWSGSGVYAQVLIPVFFVQLVVSPLSMTLVAMEKQSLQFSWDVIRLLLVFCVILLAYLLEFEINQIIILYAICMFIMYLVLYYVISNELERACREWELKL